jgi:phenylalanyl-tRNA synthetase beta chain
MRFSYRWLRDYFHARKSLPEVLEGFTMSGMEVESVVDMGGLSKKLVIGKILQVGPHPDAENLLLCKVDIARERPLSIVCGAKNVKVGDRVPIALDGMHLTNGSVIQHTRIRGEVSEGMLCAGDELGLNDDHSGILILPEDFPVGEPLDALIDISITPNRGDCYCLIGLARDLAGFFSSRIAYPTVRIMETMERIDNYLRVTVANKEGCPRYGARYIRGVRVGPSPAWLVYRLASAGIRSLNNVVDATNYVMLEYGQPIHAFDMDRVANRHIIVRNAKEGEVLEMLDGEMLKLTSQDLLITDPREPIALAGIMGGLSSRISPSTINVVLECAYFDPITIRRSSRRLSKKTEASFRFERNVDREGIPRVLERVAMLIRELAGGEIAQGMIDVKNYRSSKKSISLSVSKTNKVLGTRLNPREIANFLVALEFEIIEPNPELITFAIPSHRNDITRDIDLIEEVARMYGYEKIKPTLPYHPAEPVSFSPISRMTAQIKSALSALGFDETINYSFTSSRLEEALGLLPEGAVKITNPISPDQDIMRTSLLPSLIECMVYNLNRDIFDIRVYEIGKVYERRDKEMREEVHLMAGICGDSPSTWQKPGSPVNFYDIKGAAEILKNLFGFSSATLEPLTDVSYYHPGRAARFVRDNMEICRFGELHPIIAERLELERHLYLLDMNLSRIAPIAKRAIQFRPIPKFPSISRDLAIVLNDAVIAQSIEEVIREKAGETLESLTFFDLYKGTPVPEGKKSLAYSLTFRSPERTLTDAEIDQVMMSIFAALKEKFDAMLR